MAVHAHATRPEDLPVGTLLGAAYGRPPYSVVPSGRPCAGLTSPGFHCTRNALWLLPEADYCAHHVPYGLLGVVLARRELWLGLAADVWRDILAAEPALRRSEPGC
jgi:hypothetical protein